MVFPGFQVKWQPSLYEIKALSTRCTKKYLNVLEKFNFSLRMSYKIKFCKFQIVLHDLKCKIYSLKFVKLCSIQKNVCKKCIKL